MPIDINAEMHGVFRRYMSHLDDVVPNEPGTKRNNIFVEFYMTEGGWYEFLFYIAAVLFGLKFDSEKLGAVASVAFYNFTEFLFAFASCISRRVSSSK